MAYKITIVLPDGAIRNTRFRDMDLDTAEELAEGIRFGTDPNGNANGIQVIDQDTGDIYSEWEW